MRPRGFRAATRSALMSWRTIWQKTFRSRTRRAMSWPYWAPKSKIKTHSVSSVLVMTCRRLLNGIAEVRKQFFDGRFVLNGAMTAEALDLPLELIAVISQFDLPTLA